MIDIKLSDVLGGEPVTGSSRGMTVADLRKTLEGVPDDVLVVRKDEGYVVIAGYAGLKNCYEARDDDFGHYIDPDGPFTVLAKYDGTPMHPVFLID